MVKLVGTGGNQVPTNNMLGNMAFQNKEGVTIDLLGLGAGTAAAPSLIPFGDPNTGIWFPAADTVAISTGGSERVRIDGSGNLGVGMTPVAAQGILQVRVASGYAFKFHQTSTYAYIAANNEAGSANVDMRIIGGNLQFAPGGAEAMRITAAGNVGIGNIAPAFKLEVTGTAFISTSLRTPQLNNNAGVIGIEGNTSAFPGLKRSATTLQVRLADDTADAPLSASIINATTIPVNTPAISTSGFSLTGNNAFSLFDMAGQWNTTGNPSAIRLNINNIASGASALLMELGTTDIGVYTARFTVSKAGNVTLADGGNLAVGLSTGTKIGTATSQKIGFWNVTPIIQPTTSVAAATFVANAGTAVNDASTFDGYTISKVVKALRNLGLLA